MAQSLLIAASKFSSFNSPPEVPADRGWGWMASMAQKTNGMQGSEGIAPGSHKSAQTFPLQNKPSYQKELQNYVNDTCKKNRGSQNNLASRWDFHEHVASQSWSEANSDIFHCLFSNLNARHWGEVEHPANLPVEISYTTCRGNHLLRPSNQQKIKPSSTLVYSLIMCDMVSRTCQASDSKHFRLTSNQSYQMVQHQHETIWCNQTCQRHLSPTQLHNLHSYSSV